MRSAGKTWPREGSRRSRASLRGRRLRRLRQQRRDCHEAARTRGRGASAAPTDYEPANGAVSRRWRGAARAAALWAALVFAVVPAAAQTPTATTGVVSGAVTDSSGAMLPGVAVVLTEVGTNTTREAVTSTSGRYLFVNVLPGRYQIKATLEGFQQTIVSEFVVEVNKSHTVDVKLEVGRVTESVEVAGATAVSLQKNDSSVINTLSADTVLSCRT